MDIKSIVSQQEDTEGSVGDQEPEPTWWSESGPSTPEATEQYSQYPNLTETTPQRRVKGRRRTLTTPLPSPAHMVEQIPHKHIMADVGQTSATPSFAPPLAPSLAPPYPAPSSSHPSTKAPDSTRRQAHILSEQKRRENINAGFEDLRKAVPPCANTTDSKALILRKAIHYIKSLEAEIERLKRSNSPVFPNNPPSLPLPCRMPLQAKPPTTQPTAEGTRNMDVMTPPSHSYPEEYESVEHGHPPRNLRRSYSLRKYHDPYTMERV